jgi:TolB-like protein
MKATLNLLTVGLFCTLLASCSFFIKDYNLVKASYKAADKLLDGVEDFYFLKPDKQGIYAKQPLLVSSFVNIDNLQQSSTFGRVIAEQIGSRFAQHGYKIIEMKMRTGSIFVQEKTGELVLSRQLREISFQHDAYAVVVGTYGESKESVYVTAKLVRAKDSVILSSYDYWLPVGPDTKQMLRKRG